MDNKLSPVKESLNQDSTDMEEDHDMLESIKEEAPGWFVNFFFFFIFLGFCLFSCFISSPCSTFVISKILVFLSMSHISFLMNKKV